MYKLFGLLSAFMLVILSTAFVSEAQAQATRTWVSGTGNDTNPCSRSAPCLTFAGAISKTAASGLISVLDRGAFGTVTITKSITIDGAGIIGSTLSSSTTGFNVNGANVRVVLRNIDIEGAPVTSPGVFGIRFIQGTSLELQNISIRNVTGGSEPTCIAFSPSSTARLVIDNVTVSNCGSGSTVGGGIVIKPTGGGSKNILIRNAKVSSSSRGIVFDGTGNTGAMFASVEDSSVFISAGAGIVAQGPAGGGTVRLELDGVTSSNNNTQGVLASGPGAVVTLSDSNVKMNTTGVQATGGGSLTSYKNNRISGNTSNGTPITAVPGGPLN